MLTAIQALKANDGYVCSVLEAQITVGNTPDSSSIASHEEGSQRKSTNWDRGTTSSSGRSRGQTRSLAERITRDENPSSCLNERKKHKKRSNKKGDQGNGGKGRKTINRSA